jgi:hypothetical protein
MGRWPLFRPKAIPENNILGAVIAMPTFGDLIRHNPIYHILVADGGFHVYFFFNWL